MVWLLIVSFVWAFSFGLIKGRLAGLDPSLVSLIRVTMALVVFLPVFRPRGLRMMDTIILLCIGAVQFGVMYVSYIASFHFLAAYEVALLTIFTPLFVSLFSDGLRLGWKTRSLLAALIATVGAGVILADRPLSSVTWAGVVLIQIANVSFAIGQVAFRKWKHARPQFREAQVFALPYAGAVLATFPLAARELGSIGQITGEQWLTLAYLGVIASGVCFFLWNYGAVRTASGPLAVVNNLKIPLSVACSLLVFGENANVPRLLIGGVLVVIASIIAELGARRAKESR